MVSTVDLSIPQEADRVVRCCIRCKLSSLRLLLICSNPSLNVRDCMCVWTELGRGVKIHYEAYGCVMLSANSGSDIGFAYAPAASVAGLTSRCWIAWRSDKLH